MPRHRQIVVRDLPQGDLTEDHFELRESEMPRPALRLVGKAIRASERELAENSRARSAMLRVAEKQAA